MSALDQQPGGNHYKDKAIQPIQYIHANGLGYCEGNVVKYVTRWRDKNGLQDLLKAKHYIDLLIELERLDEPQTEAWDQGDARMDNIARNGNDGGHYSVQLEVGEDFMVATSKNPHKL
jgi:hypothetical protein